ncbi:MAG: hypothetical protein LBU94_05275 [Clostridiales bacterium]|jgi:hypothetical protein|nr:hypothetical protein [Clostridiales bacterium]
MPLTIGKIKIIIIGFLAMLAVYQTSRLWFDDSLGHNFFYRLTDASEDQVDEGIYKSFTYPYRVVTSFGGNRFVMSYADMKSDKTRILGDEILLMGLKNGEFVSQSTIDWNTILSFRSVIYEYSFSMPVDLFTQNFPKRTELLSQGFTEFDTVVLSADPFSSNLMRLYFINREKDVSVEINVKSVDLCDSLKFNIQDTQKAFSDNDIYYVSTRLLHLNTPDNQFIPRWREEGYSYMAVDITTTYHDEEFDKSRIRANLMSFFDNPSAVWDSSGEIISSSDENVVVRYMDNDVLEYTNYGADMSDRDTNLTDDYVAALKFIQERDLLLENQLYFAGSEEAGEYRYLHFNYIAGEFPVMFTDQLLSDMGDLEYGITVTFRNGNIINYKRLAYTFTLNETRLERAMEDYLGLMEAYNLDVSAIYDISFGYYADVLDHTDTEQFIRLAIELMVGGQRWALT